MTEGAKGQVSRSAADVYEQYFVPALFGGWADIVVSKANISYGASVIDIACGTGALTRAVAGRTGPEGRVIGVDLNDGMIQTARRVAPLMEWRVAPAEELPFTDNQFDNVVCQFGFMFFDGKVKALSEMRRVLKPGGQITVAIWDGLENNPGYNSITALLARLFGESVANELRAPFRFGDVDVIKDYFSDAGMRDVAIETRSSDTKYQSIEAWMHLDVKGWTIDDMIDDQQYEQLVSEAKIELDHLVQADGTVQFPSPAHIVTWQKS